MEIKIQINTCLDCKHKGHSGAFTPGGAISICRHQEAPTQGIIEGVNGYADIKTEEIAQAVFGPKQLLDYFEIPTWCPMNNGYDY